ncbi:MAG: tetratricopeptide repeat protein [Taibaiella sp.]|nr:tetratricopeptide repeat protein [Taibaiella sp.]
MIFSPLFAGALSLSIPQLLGKLKQNGSDSEKNEVYKQLIATYKNSNIDSAIYYGEKGVIFALKNNYRIGQADMIAALGDIDQEQGRYETARRRFTYALNLYREQNYTQGTAEIYNYLGEAELIKKNTPGAIGWFKAALRLQDSISDKEGLLTSCINLGDVYLNMCDTNNASAYLLRAEAESRNMGITEKVITLNTSLGKLYYIRGDKVKAMAYFKNGAKISDNPDFLAAHVESLRHLGTFCNETGEIKPGIAYLETSLNIAREKKLADAQGYLLLDLAGMNKKSDPARALRYLREATEVSHGMKALKSAALLAEISAMYAELGSYSDAYAVNEKQISIIDSLAIVNKTKEIAGLNAVYQLEMSKTRVRELEQLMSANNQQRNIISGISVGIVLALIVLIIYYRKARKLNIALAQQEARLTELNVTKDKLFSIIGHDLRAPVARVPMILEICDDSDTTAEEKEYLMLNMKEHIYATIDTLDKLLYWGKSLMRGETIKPEKIKTKHFITENIGLKKSSVVEKEITVLDPAPDVEVYSDAGHFDFIIRNLFANAVKFTNRGGTVTIDADTNKLSGYTVFTVADTGVGMDEYKLKHLFEPFNSMDGTAHEKGTGIGLMLCKEFAIKNGGDIWAESKLREGSIFYYSVKKAD